MGLIKSNYSQALDQVRPGLYDACVEHIDEHTSKKGTLCAKVAFRIIGSDFNNRRLPCILPLEGKAAGFFRKFVQAIKADYIDGEIDAAELIGKSVRIKVGQSKTVEGEHSYLRISIFPFDYRPMPEDGPSQPTEQAGA